MERVERRRESSTWSGRKREYGGDLNNYIYMYTAHVHVHDLVSYTHIIYTTLHMQSALYSQTFSDDSMCVHKVTHMHPTHSLCAGMYKEYRYIHSSTIVRL